MSNIYFRSTCPNWKVKSFMIQFGPVNSQKYSDQDNSYKKTINGFQVRKINKIRNVIFGLPYGKPSSALRPKLECSSS